MAARQPTSGRARTVLVFGAADAATAAISTVVVRTRSRTSKRRVRFNGPVLFDDSSAKHIENVLLPIADRITDGLSLPRQGFEIAVANLAGASVADLKIKVSGFSADVPVLLAMLSACLQIPLPQDLVSTGHLASPDGDIRTVGFISAKLAAAAGDGSIRRFVYPNLDRDPSLEAFSPEDRQQASDAIANISAHLRTIAVSDLSELMPVVFDGEAVALASLQKGFFVLAAEPSDAADPVSRTTAFLTSRPEARFWTALERHLLAGATDKARSLLAARVRFEMDRRNYPRGLGLRLLQLVLSLPPLTRRSKGFFPLLEMNNCVELGCFAGKEDHEDVRQLIDAAMGKALVPSRPAGEKDPPARGGRDPVLEGILSQISADFLAREIGLPIDSARLSYIVQSATVASYDEFLEIVSAFYLHLRRHTQGGTAPVNTDAVATEAMAFLDRAFARRGGWKAAPAEAQDGTHGGMRAVLDIMTDQYKSDAKAQHVQRVLKLALDPLDWREQVAMITALLREMGPMLPARLRSASPATFVHGWDILVQAYVESLDRVREVLKTF